MAEPTLAKKLGTTTHLSALLHKSRRLGLEAGGLECLAIIRGCTYYHDGKPLPAIDVPEDRLSDEELAIALLNPALRYHPQTLRPGAAMLGAAENDPARLAWLTKLERSEAVVGYVARCGRQFEPENEFWGRLLALLPATSIPNPDVAPHPTRFVAMTGLTRNSRTTRTQWIQPTRRPPGHG